MKYSKLLSVIMLGTIITGGVIGSNSIEEKVNAAPINESKIEVNNESSKEIGAFIVTAKSGANLRKGPGTNYAIIKAFPKGTVLWRVKPLPDKNGWYNVETEDGRYRGWMHESTGYPD